MEQTLCRSYRCLQIFTLESHADDHKVMCSSVGPVQLLDEILQGERAPTYFSAQR